MNKKIFLSGIISAFLILSGCGKPKTVSSRYTGTVEADSYLITSEVSGQIKNLFISQGDKILVGSKIVEIDNSMYKLNKEAAEANLKIAKAKENQVPDRANDDVKDQAEGAVEAAEAQVKMCSLQIDKCSIKAFNSGVISILYVNKGEIVSQGTNIAKAYDLNNEYLKVYIEESKRGKVQLNKAINIYINDNEIIKGRISYISPEAEFTPKNTETKEDKENTVFMIKIKLDKNDKAYPGMMADAEIN